MIIKKIYFSATDGAMLFGLLHLPDSEKATKVVVATHGITSQSVPKVRDDIEAQKLTDGGVAYFCFDNRGFGLVNYVKFKTESGTVKRLCGTAFDDVLSGACDIIGAVEAMIQEGFEDIVLQGHSMGSLKTIIAYRSLLRDGNTVLLEKIKQVILLSPVDLKTVLVNSSNEEILLKAQKLVEEGNENEMIWTALLGSPFVAKTIVELFNNIDQIGVTTEQEGLECPEFNQFLCPLLVCFGEDDITLTPPKLLIKKLKKKSAKTEFVVIDNTNHSYSGKEGELASKLTEFVSGK